MRAPPCRTLIGTAEGRYLRRALGGDGRPACLPMQPHEMVSLQGDRGLLDDSATVAAGASCADLDPLELERLRRSIRERRGRGDETLLELPDEELARILGAYGKRVPAASARGARGSA